MLAGRLEVPYNSMHSPVLIPRSFFAKDEATVYVLRVIRTISKVEHLSKTEKSRCQRWVFMVLLAE